MRWPFGPPHLTLKPSKKNNEQKKKTKQEKTEKTNNKRFSKLSFSVISLFFFGVGVQNFLFFDYLAQKNAHPQNTIKIRVSAFSFLKKDMRHETAIFGPKKPKSRNSSYLFFLAYLLLFQQQKPQKTLKPLFL